MFDRENNPQGGKPATSTTAPCSKEDQQKGERGDPGQEEGPEGDRREFKPISRQQSLVFWQPQETHKTCQVHCCLQGPLTVTKVIILSIVINVNSDSAGLQPERVSV